MHLCGRRQGSLRGEDHGDTSKDPLSDILLFRLHLEASSEDEGWTSTGRSVDWAVVDGDSLLLLTLDGCDMNNGHFWMQFLELHIDEVTLFVTAAHFPTSTFKEESSDVGTSCGECRVVLNSERVFDFSPEAQIIQRQVLGASSYLHDGREVGHGVEEVRDLQDRWSLNVIGPFLELKLTRKQFKIPLLQCLLGWVCICDPFRWEDVDFKGCLEHLHGVCDIERTIKTLVELVQ